MASLLDPSVPLVRSARPRWRSGLCALALGTGLWVGHAKADLAAHFSSAASVPVTAPQYTAAGNFSVTLGFAPPTGTDLVVVENTSLAFISGQFANLAQGQVVTAEFNGTTYRFLADYFGGSGNDLVLRWANRQPISWGLNNNGQLGDGTFVDRLQPIRVSTTGNALQGKTVTKVYTGEGHSLALCSDGSIAAWGLNGNGQLGNGSTTFSALPVAVVQTGALAGKTVVALAAGQYHSLALCSDGTVASWGRNNHGQLGDGTVAPRSAPVAVRTNGVLSGKTVVAVSAGGFFSAALCSDGTLVTWGRGTEGALGNGSFTTSNVPVAVSTSGALLNKSVVQISAGFTHLLARCSDHTLAAWGANDDGRLGNGSATASNVPVLVDASGVLAGKAIAHISAGEHNLALCADGTLAAWGLNASGQLGDGSTSPRSTPVAVNLGALGGRSISASSAARLHSLVLCADGAVFTWGDNQYAQLGNQSRVNSPLPVSVDSTLFSAGETFGALLQGGSGLHNLALAVQPPAPAVKTFAAGQPTLTSVLLQGQVQPAGEDATVVFEYGPTPAYGHTVAAAPSLVGGVVPVEVSATLANVPAGSTIHYRLRATSNGGTSTGADRVLVTHQGWAWNSASQALLTSRGYVPAGNVTLALQFQPSGPTDLTVVNNLDTSFLGGRFDNLAQGQLVTLAYGGISYAFVANYYGGNGNDLVLHWARTTPAAWGENGAGQIGDGTSIDRNQPTAVAQNSAVTGRLIGRLGANQSATLAATLDGTLVRWGEGIFHQSNVPAQVPLTGSLSGKIPIDVAVSPQRYVVLASDGTISTWGFNSGNQLGYPFPIFTNSTTPLALLITPEFVPNANFVAVAAGQTHNLALCSDGTVVSWGDLLYLAHADPSAGFLPGLVDASGALAGKKVSAIAAGGRYSLLLCTDGTLVSWGENDRGQLGVGTLSAREDSPLPIPPTGLLAGRTVVQIAAGSAHNLALCADGMLVAWGRNDHGQLGNHSSVDSPVPVAVDLTGALAGRQIVKLVCGASHSAVLCADGTVVAWGRNEGGQLGDGSFVSSTFPVLASHAPLHAFQRIGALACGPSSDSLYIGVQSPLAPQYTLPTVSQPDAATIELRTELAPNGLNTSVTFEYGLTTDYGQIFVPTPASVSGGGSIPVVVSFNQFSDFLRFGQTYHFRMRVTNGFDTFLTPDQTFVMTNTVTHQWNSAADVAATLPAYSAAGGAVTLSLNFAPPAGTNLTLVNVTGPAPIDGRFTDLEQGQAVVLAYGGQAFRYLVDYFGGTGNDLVLQWADVQLVAWGLNQQGQCGISEPGMADILSPRALPATGDLAGEMSGRVVRMAAAGVVHTSVVCFDGRVAGWGQNTEGQVSPDRISWGSIPRLVPATGALEGKTAVAVAAGYYHTLALCSDGTIAAWGSDNSGQLGDGTGPTQFAPVQVQETGALAGKRVIAIAAGGHSSAALCSDGTVVTWGSNISGQLGDGTNDTSPAPVAVRTSGALSGKFVVEVVVGSGHMLARCSDGTVVAWGDNMDGQLGNGSHGARNEPVLVSTAAGSALQGKTVAALGASYHSLALCTDGTVASWGRNSEGQLGLGTTTANQTLPVAVHGLLAGQAVTRLSPGWIHSLVGCSDETAFSWGNNYYGMLGVGLNSQQLISSLVPLATPGVAGLGARISSLAQGSLRYHNLVVITNPARPTAQTQAIVAPSLGATSVVVTGLVTAGGSKASVSFEYGPGAHEFTQSATPALVVGGPQSVSAQLSNLQPGTFYRYRVRAENAGGSTVGSEQAFVTLTFLEQWRLTHFGSVANAGAGADAADFDGDGLPNLLEYAYGLDPTVPNSSALLPQLQRNGSRIGYVFDLPAIAAGVTYRAEWSPTLTGTWTPIPNTGSGNSFRFDVPVGADTKKFFRLRVTSP